MRLLIAGCFLLFAGIAIGISLSNGSTSDDFLLNLGTEIVGIVLTVAVVDFLFERRKNKESAKAIAWEIMHELDHAIWVWQGGAREFDIDEMAGLLSLSEPTDPLPQFTQNLFLRIGSRADNTFRTKREVINISSSLSQSLNVLKPLSKMRDGTAVISAEQITKISSDALEHLADVVGVKYRPDLNDELAKHRDTQILSQEWRHYGNDEGVYNKAIKADA
ncbi:hypothetical protein HGP28_03590 [Vibrio sp. SM6]|uniref:Uncharacterized protein n=1 Tax=Vibrio agarilyticus TaxID=2726741 RepID=A0A7X8TNG6_9VIBR|nr:hypothetical protein [Vibrio agarilyticus]NLS11973.1 hypothetical protein [Vibrio agarilyticus]